MSLENAKIVTAALAAVACLLVPAVVAAPSQAAPKVGRDPAVIREWNAIAVRTISHRERHARSGLAALLRVHLDRDARRRRGHRGRLRAVPRAAARPRARLARGRRGDGGASRAAALLPRIGGEPRRRLRGIPRRRAERRRQGARHPRRSTPLRTRSSRCAPTTTSRRCTRSRRNRASASGSRLPPGFAPMAVSWLGFVTPFVLDSPTSIPPARARSRRLRRVRRRLRRGQGEGRADRIDPHRRRDGDGPVLETPSDPVVQYNVAMRDRDRGARPGHQRDRACVRAARTRRCRTPTSRAGTRSGATPTGAR